MSGKELTAIPSVTDADLDAIETMNKDELEVFVIKHFDIDVDKRKRLKELRSIAATLVKKALGTEQEEPVEEVPVALKVEQESKYILNPSDGVAYARDPWARHHADWVACDAKGKPL